MPCSRACWRRRWNRRPQPRRPRSQLRRRALAVAGAACAALAGFVAIDLVDSDAPGPGVVDRAVAAVTRAGSVYHVVELDDLPRRGRARGLPGVRTSSPGTRPTVVCTARRSAVRDGRAGPPARGLRRTTPAPRPRERTGASVGRVLQHDRGERIRRRRPGLPRPLRGPGLPAARAPGSRDDCAWPERRRWTASAPTGWSPARSPRTRTRWRSRSRWTPRPTCPSPSASRSRRQAGQKTETLTRYRAYERLALNDESRGRLALDPHPGREVLPVCARADGAARPRVPEPLRGRELREHPGGAGGGRTVFSRPLRSSRLPPEAQSKNNQGTPMSLTPAAGSEAFGCETRWQAGFAPPFEYERQPTGLTTCTAYQPGTTIR